MILFKKTKHFSQILENPDLKPKHEYISVQQDSSGQPLYRATWLGKEIRKMEIQYRGQVIGYALTNQEWQDFIQEHAKGENI